MVEVIIKDPRFGATIHYEFANETEAVEYARENGGCVVVDKIKVYENKKEEGMV